MTRLIAIAAVALIVAGGVLFLQTSRPDSGLVTLGAAQAQNETQNQAQDGAVDTSLVTEMVLGDPDAAIEVIEYASFTCPHCKTFHAGPFQQLKADYIDTGKIRFVYREVYFDRFGLWAGMVARCGGADRYFGITDLIYDRQAEWSRAGSPAEVAEGLRRIGRTAGLDADRLDACLTDEDMARAMIAVWEENRIADEITSTPSFVIDGEKYGNMPYSEFAAILDDKLAE